MKERPILFSGPMVRAILEGKKTQTRRAFKRQPEGDGPFERAMAPGIGETLGEYAFKKADGKGWDIFQCPFGQAGNRLWVKEAWAAFDDDWRFPGRPNDLRDGPWKNILYACDPANSSDYHIGFKDLKWRPSIHMPRWASRISLEITKVRVERIQSISEQDALAGGFVGHREEPFNDDFLRMEFKKQDGSFHPVMDFEDYCRGKNGPKWWESNPFCWVIEFKRV